MASAIVIANYLIPHALIALGLTGPRSGHTGRARAILAWIRRKRLTSFKASEVLDALSRSQFPTAEAVNAALVQLEQLGWIRNRSHPPRRGRGRPASPTYDVNPRAHS
jgi:hypothetical protein